MGRSSSELAVRLVVVIVALALVGWSALGAGVASAQNAETYAVRQGDRCVGVTPLSGNESVRAFYGYESTFEDNPYTTAIGPGFSSEGTVDLQRAETSLLFLYAAPDGSLSLVMVHGAREAGEDGGSASFNLSGLPADGRWAVKDDEYDSPENADDWSHGETTARVDWTWSRSATDGGAFAGLGDDFEVTVEPAFNGEAELFGQVNFGVVENWTLLSGDRANPNRTALDRSETVTVSTEPCDDADGGGERDADRGEDGRDRDGGDGGGDDEGDDEDEDHDEDDDDGRFDQDERRGDAFEFGDDDGFEFPDHDDDDDLPWFAGDDEEDDEEGEDERDDDEEDGDDDEDREGDDEDDEDDDEVEDDEDDDEVEDDEDDDEVKDDEDDDEVEDDEDDDD